MALASSKGPRGWTHIRRASEGNTGIGLYPDGLIEHDGMMGDLLAKVDEMELPEDTIVAYGSDNDGR